MSQVSLGLAIDFRPAMDLPKASLGLPKPCLSLPWPDVGLGPLGLIRNFQGLFLASLGLAQAPKGG